MTAITLSKGDIGVLIRPDGVIDALLPDGAKRLEPKHMALIGAAFQVQNDEAYREAAAKAFVLYHTPPAGSA